MKFTIFITHQCNLRCNYCYIDKKHSRLSYSNAERIIDFIFIKSSFNNEKINIGFFGGEPLLEFERIKEITFLIKNHPLYNSKRVKLSLVTNGTIFSDDIADFIIENNIGFGISCDGIPFVQDLFRRSKSGSSTSSIVEENIIKSKQAFSNVMVNAVYHPQTYKYLPQSIKYFASLGVKQIYLSPDFSAFWQREDINYLPEIFNEIGKLYIDYYLQGDPHFISLIDSKIAVILRDGFGEMERCQMGRCEFSFTTDGDIYPCERLVGNGENTHNIGNINEGIKQHNLSRYLGSESEINSECTTCGIKEYCMNWCGCSNFFSTGYYNRVSSFQCASEKAAIETSFNAFKVLEQKLGPTFFEHVGGLSVINSIS